MSKLFLTLLGTYGIFRDLLRDDSSAPERSDDRLIKMRIEFLTLEYKNANDRLAGYSEADQKIIAVAATIIVGALGFTLAKIEPTNAKALPYVFFLSAGLINLAVLQSVLYSSLALFTLERKVRLALQIEKLLDVPSTETILSALAFNLTYKYSYSASVIPYYIFKSLAGSILLSFIFNYDRPDFGDKLYWMAFTVSATSSAISFGVVWFNAYEQRCFGKYFLSKYKAERSYRNPL